ncbi:hypothetical protein E2P84_03800 [Burkholderia cepacia]|uniref:hypothetical protein n=1 Tax=Burkholderia cepacia TaxID=292 RepID=UPI0010678771|nr:hypothetical protein [Burkholderia cepacia]TES82277.1 hypothetical protein E2P84_03800 [Burkholderia cepacia]
MTALAALTAADLRALADVEEPRFAQYWASGVWFHAGDRSGWHGIGWAVWMECAARAWIPPHAESLTAWGVTDGRALVRLAYDEDEARSWAVDARAEHRNRQMPPPLYNVVRLSAAGNRGVQPETAPQFAEPPRHIIDAAMDVARLEYGHGVTRASIVAIWKALGSPWYAPANPPADERAAFEAYAVEEGMDMSTFSDGTYRDTHTAAASIAWAASIDWQDRAAAVNAATTRAQVREA